MVTMLYCADCGMVTDHRIMEVMDVKGMVTQIWECKYREHHDTIPVDCWE